MPTNFPTTLDDLPSPTETDSHNTPGLFHDVLHANMADAMEAVQDELSGVAQTRSKTFHVKDIGGATGDLVADDRAALQATIDAAELVKGTVVLDPATGYLLTSGSLVIDSPITLIAYGKASPIRQEDWGVPAIEIRSADVRILGELYCEYTGTRDAFDGADLTASPNSATVKTECSGDPKAAGSALYLRSSNRLYVERLHVKGFIAGVLFGSGPTAVDQHIESILVDTVDFGVWSNPGINTTIGSIKGRTITRTQGVDEHIVYWTEHGTRSIGNYIGAVQVSGVATAVSHAVSVKSVDDFHIGSLSASGVGALFVAVEAQGVVDFILARDMTEVLATDNTAAVLAQTNSDVTVGGCDIESNAEGTDTTNKSRVFDSTGTSRLIVRSAHVKMMHATPGPVFRNSALSWIYDPVIEYVNALPSGLAAFLPAGTKSATVTQHIFRPSLLGTAELMRPEGSSIAYEVYVDPVDLWIGPPWAPWASTAVAFTANQARLMAFQVQRTVTVTNAYIRIAVQSGNLSVGIYDDAGTRLATSGAVACPAAGPATVALTAGVTLIPGRRYWAAVSIDNATATIGSYTNNTLSNVPGYIKQGAVATSHPIPTTITIPTTEAGSLISVQYA